VTAWSWSSPFGYQSASIICSDQSTGVGVGVEVEVAATPRSPGPAAMATVHDLMPHRDDKQRAGCVMRLRHELRRTG
jgi:hypothetical protein